ncbi:MAG: N-methyl-L-tryptophan oxidase [Planctomycetaceae bacterium]
MNFDVIVLGTGGVGSAALFHLAKQGLRVLGLDRFPPGHDRGSSHGESRVIRRSYFEHPDYVPLLNMAYALWDDLSEQCGRTLLHRTGILYFGAAEGQVVNGIQTSAAQHNLTIECLDIQEAANRFPVFTAPENTTAIFERDAGYLRVEDCVTAHVSQALQRGAQQRHGETVLNWSATDDGVTVLTQNGRYEADRLIITAGAWTNDLLTELKIPLRVVRKHLHWHAVTDDRCLSANGCPCYFMESQGGYFYGCPAIGSDGFKIAEHSGGVTVPDPLTDLTTPDIHDTARVDTFRSRHLTGVSPTRTRHQRCFYTMTPDEHFVVDRHPQFRSVAFAAGLSGHGFKFTSVLGRILAELVTTTEPCCEIGFFSLNRSALKASDHSGPTGNPPAGA